MVRVLPRDTPQLSVNRLQMKNRFSDISRARQYLATHPDPQFKHACVRLALLGSRSIFAQGLKESFNLSDATVAHLLDEQARQNLREEIDYAQLQKLGDWARRTFIEESGKLHNEDHFHLNQARIGWLWTNAPNSRQMKMVVGTAEIPKPPSMLSSWQKARWNWQMRQWFGAVPDFVITFSAFYAARVNNVTWCASVEHELYHCAQALKDGLPWFRQSDGRPVFAIKGHDVEEHLGVIVRYGAGAGAGDTRKFVEAARKKPLIGEAEALGVCGTCVRLAA